MDFLLKELSHIKGIPAILLNAFHVNLARFFQCWSTVKVMLQEIRDVNMHISVTLLAFKVERTVGPS